MLHLGNKLGGTPSRIISNQHEIICIIKRINNEVFRACNELFMSIAQGVYHQKNSKLAAI